MLTALTALLTALNALTPYGIIALLGVIIFLLVGKPPIFKGLVFGQKEIAENHLHVLPDLVDTLDAIKNTLQRMEVAQAEGFSYLKARINGFGGPK